MRLEELPILCISLDRRPDRWAEIHQQAVKTGLHIQRLSAVDAREFDATTHPAVSLEVAHNIRYGVRRSHHEIDRAGAVGASLSHFKAWEILTKTPDAPAMIVLEDDADLPVDLKPRLERLLSELPAEWDIIQLQRTEFAGGVYGCKPVIGLKGWQECTSLMGAHAYIISRAGAERMLARAYPIEMHVDAYMAYMARMGHIRMLWHPLIDIPSKAEDSDIQHGDGSILNVPTDIERAGLVVLDQQAVIGILSMAAVVGGLVALAYLIPRPHH